MSYWIQCGCGKRIRRNISGKCWTCVHAPDGATPVESTPVAPPTPETDIERRRQSAAINTLQGKYTKALETIDRQQHEMAAMGFLRQSAVATTIEPHLPSGTSEGVVVVNASDWHAEETVTREQTSGRNEFNLERAKERSTTFFQAALRLTRLLQQDIKIRSMVLSLLGDFISNADLHDGEQQENTALGPVHAAIFAQNLIISGIEFLLNNSDLTLTIPCHSGNHARTTHKVRPGHENAHSLEYFMYHSIAGQFKNEPRVEFLIPESQDSVVNVMGYKVRFQHGHAIKYNGGVGGLSIPANKATDIWNRTEQVDLDVFGHFHQLLDGGKWLCNGSLIGYNAFAKFIKAPYEPPRQALFLVDKRRGRTCTWPILFKR